MFVLWYSRHLIGLVYGAASKVVNHLRPVRYGLTPSLLLLNINIYAAFYISLVSIYSVVNLYWELSVLKLSSPSEINHLVSAAFSGHCLQAGIVLGARTGTR